MKARKDELVNSQDYSGLGIGDNWETGERVVKDEGEASGNPLPEEYVE